jgi:hypothetical protein
MNTLSARVWIAAIVLGLSGEALAQSAVWSYSFGDTNRSVSGIVADTAGNALAVGYRYTPGFAPLERFVTKLSPSGELAWTFTSGPGPNYNSVYSAGVDANGDVILLDRVPGTTTLRFQKLSAANGAVLASWTHPEPGAVNLYLGGLAFATNGDITVLVQYSIAGPPLHNRNTLLRFDTSGNLHWDTFSVAIDTPQDVVSPLQVDAQGNAWYEDYFGGTDWRLVKVDGQGHISWSASYVDPRGADNGSVGLTIDSTGTAHWYMSLHTSSGNNLPAVHVRIDPAGNLVGSQDLMTNPAWNGYHCAFHRLAHAGRSLLTSDVLIEVRDESGQLLWNDVIPPPAGYQNAYAAPQLDPDGGMLLQLEWTTSFYPTTTLHESRRYDSSGHMKWMNGPGSVPLAPDASTLGWTSPSSGSVVITKYDTQSSGFCYGDGTLGVCPCGNVSAPAQQAGCAHSLGYGASLSGSGTASVTADGLVLSVQGATGTTLLVAQGNAYAGNGAGTTLGDGLLCVGGSILRIATRSLAGGSMQYPQPADASISVRGGVTSPGTRTYQAFFRNAAAFCTPSTQATTNGVTVHWQP